MWLCFNDGFLSVVADKNNPERLMVRARRQKDLVNVFGGGISIIETPQRDYRWRTSVDRAVFKEIVGQRIDSISYGNFKNSVQDDDLHGMYLDFWDLHRRYQKRDRIGTK